MNSISSKIVLQNWQRGIPAWLSQLSISFSSGHEPTVLGSSPTWGCLLHWEPASPSLSFPLPDCSRCRLPNPQSVDRSRFYLSGLGCSLLRETHFLLLSTASCSPGLCFCCWLFLFCLLCVTGLGPWVSCFNSLTSDPVLPCPCTCWI